MTSIGALLTCEGHPTRGTRLRGDRLRIARRTVARGRPEAWLLHPSRPGTRWHPSRALGRRQAVRTATEGRTSGATVRVVRLVVAPMRLVLVVRREHRRAAVERLGRAMHPHLAQTIPERVQTPRIAVVVERRPDR